MTDTLRLVLKITGSRAIMRRYFFVNGFDGALTMFGIAVGFRISTGVDVSVVISACVGAAVALGMSGVTSAYLSESAERRKQLQDLERAMARDLAGTAHGVAAKLIPWIVALVNGLTPLIISLLIILPLFLERAGIPLPIAAVDAAIGLAFTVIFLLGVFLGKVSGRFWLWTGLRTVLIAVVTAALILLFTGT